jgi:hypothetical protein
LRILWDSIGIILTKKLLLNAISVRANNIMEIFMIKDLSTISLNWVHGFYFRFFYCMARLTIPIQKKKFRKMKIFKYLNSSEVFCRKSKKRIINKCFRSKAINILSNECDKEKKVLFSSELSLESVIESNVLTPAKQVKNGIQLNPFITNSVITNSWL